MSFLRSLPPVEGFQREWMDFEEECEKRGSSGNTLSKMYKTVLKALVGEVTTLPYLLQWEGELERNFTEEEKNI